MDKIKDKKERQKTIVDGRAVEVKRFPAEFKLDEGEGIIEGYASVFGNKDSYGDIIDKGAFKKTIKEFIHRIKVLWQHRDPIGKPILIKEDSHGLYTKSQITLTQENRDRLMLVRDGVVTEMSIGFDTIQSKQDEENENIRHLTELKLWEYSIVTWGANDMTEVTSVKSEEEMEAILFKLNDVLLNQKEGRVLSGKNKKLVVNAIEALQILLSATQPKEPSKEEPSFKTLIEDALSPLKEIKLEQYKNDIMGELTEFGKTFGGK